jgi:hypothetical protein
MIQLQIEANKPGGGSEKRYIAQQSPSLLVRFTAIGVLNSFGDLKGG